MKRVHWFIFEFRGVFFLRFFTLFLLAYLRPLHVGFAIRRLERPREVTGTLPRFLHLAEE